MNQITVIRPRDRLSLRNIYDSFSEVIKYWELLYFFIWKNVKVRYKRTFVGIGWAVVQPFMTMVVFTIFFGKLAKLPSYDLPYPIFYYSGLLCWGYFSSSVQNATASIISNRGIITKVYIPRMIFPISAVLSGLVDFVIAFGMFLVLMVIYGIPFGIHFAFFPAFVLLNIFAALSLGIWLSALNTLYRDVQYLVPFLIQILLFASPVVYPASIVPESLRFFYGLNPMVGVVEGFRWSLTGAGQPSGVHLFSSLITMFFIFIGGLVYFKKVETKIADVV